MVQVATGFLLFSSEATKMYGSRIFQIKMLLILLAGVNGLVFHMMAYSKSGGMGQCPGHTAIGPVRGFSFDICSGSGSWPRDAGFHIIRRDNLQIMFRPPDSSVVHRWRSRVLRREKGEAELLRFCEWLEHTSWVTTISNTGWMYQTAEITHYFSLVCPGGNDSNRGPARSWRCRAPSKRRPTFRTTFPLGLDRFLLGGPIGIHHVCDRRRGLITTDTVFRVKMSVILFAILFTIIVQRKAAKWDRPVGKHTLSKLAAAYVVDFLDWRHPCRSRDRCYFRSGVDARKCMRIRGLRECTVCW